MPSQLLIRDPTSYAEQPRNASAEDRSSLGEDIASVSTAFVQPGSDRSKDARPDGDASLLNDISASPRLFGYSVILISSLVSMISSSIFYGKETKELTNMDTPLDSAEAFGLTIPSEDIQALSEIWIEALNAEQREFFHGENGNIVLEWKVFGAIAVSTLMALITLLVVIAHFDSYFFPKKFRHFFADGSTSERNLLFVLIFIAICGLCINTSRFSVGETQANVFFSTWTAFLACIFNYELWRTNAGRHLTFQNVLFDSDFPTKRFWMLLAIFSTITVLAFFENMLSSSSSSFSEEERELLNCTVLTARNRWMWMSLVGCVMSWWFLIHRTRHKLSEEGNPKLQFILETAFSGAIASIKGIAIAKFTGGIMDRVPCPSNLYFGLWGGFVVAVWIFASLLQTGSPKKK